jgi:PAS domain S-box-containing protein
VPITGEHINIRTEATEMNRESTFDSMMMGSTDLVVSFRRDGSLELVNNAFLNRLKYTKDDLMDLELGNMVASDAISDIRGALDKTFSGEVVDGVEALFIARNGTQVYIEGNLFPRKKDGDVTAALGFFRDVTARKKVERRVQEEKKRRDFFVDLLTHDITNITQEVLSTFEILLQSSELSPAMMELVKEGLAEVDRASALINNVKKLSTLMATRPETKSVDVGESLRSATGRVRGDFVEKDLVLESNLQPNDYVVLADMYLEDVFYSLLSNSMKFTRGNKVHIDVTAVYIKRTPLR